MTNLLDILKEADLRIGFTQHFKSPATRETLDRETLQKRFLLCLCQYLQSEALRREINTGLNVIENWNGANSFIFYGKSGDFATNRLDEQELAALSLHLLQICLVYVNTLLIQQVLSEPRQFQQMKQEDLRALTPLIYSHVTPYGTFRLNLTERIPIEQEAS